MAVIVVPWVAANSARRWSSSRGKVEAAHSRMLSARMIVPARAG
jgi:hypothetical protein